MAKAKARHSLGDQLREIIHSRGLGPGDLGRLAGVDHAALSRFLAGTRSITLEPTAERIAEVLGVRFVEVGASRRRPAGPKKGGTE